MDLKNKGVNMKNEGLQKYLHPRYFHLVSQNMNLSQQQPKYECAVMKVRIVRHALRLMASTMNIN